MPEQTPTNGVKPGRADYRKQYQPEAVRRWTTQAFGGLEPPTLNRILKDATRGDIEDFVDLCSYMIRTDPHLRSVVVTRIQAVAGAEIVVEPGLPGPGQTQSQAERAAEDIRDEIASMREWEDRLGDLLYGGMIGVAVLENRWRPSPDRVRSGFGFVHPRDVRFRDDWQIEVRTHPLDDNGRPGPAKWIRIADYPGKFVVHTPHNFAERPTLTGELMSVAWPWLFKRWTEKYGLSGFERMANGFLYGKVKPGAPPEARRNMKEGLEDLAADGTAIFEELEGGGNPVELLEAANDPGKAAFELIRHWNAEISKSLLGSGLNVEVTGPNGSGNRALGESQFDTTTLPRLIADGKRACGALEEQWATHYLRYNAHRYGGMPPVPRISVQLVNEDPAIVDDLIVNSAAVTVDELRVSRGLEAWGPERGGDRIVQPLAKTTPAFPSASGGAAPPPFSRRRQVRRPSPKQLSLDTTRTPSASVSPLASALSARSETRER